jgi:hypothetical protein
MVAGRIRLDYAKQNGFVPVPLGLVVLFGYLKFMFDHA